ARAGWASQGNADDFFVAKLDGTTGEERWQFALNGNMSFYDEATSVTIDAEDNVVAAGSTVNTASYAQDLTVVSGRPATARTSRHLQRPPPRRRRRERARQAGPAAAARPRRRRPARARAPRFHPASPARLVSETRPCRRGHRRGRQRLRGEPDQRLRERRERRPPTTTALVIATATTAMASPSPPVRCQGHRGHARQEARIHVGDEQHERRAVLGRRRDVDSRQDRPPRDGDVPSGDAWRPGGPLGPIMDTGPARRWRLPRAGAMR